MMEFMSSAVYYEKETDMNKIGKKDKNNHLSSKETCILCPSSWKVTLGIS
jgi:hypothetical protein